MRKSICGLLNYNGGVILLGVEEEDENMIVQGVNILDNNIEKLKNKF
jgi:predicted HTH transcriptional regulator